MVYLAPDMRQKAGLLFLIGAGGVGLVLIFGTNGFFSGCIGTGSIHHLPSLTGTKDSSFNEGQCGNTFGIWFQETGTVLLVSS